MNRLIRSLFALFLVTSISAVHAQGAWKPGPQIPQGANEVIGAVVNGHILVYGGQDTKGPMGVFWDFDPASGQWSTLPSNPVPVHHAATAVVGNTVYVFGGFRNPDSGKTNWWPESKVWAFDYDKKTWSAMPPLPTARSGTGISVVDGRIHVLGGEGWTDNFGGVFRTHEVFDPKTNTWATYPRMLYSCHGFATATIGRRIYAISGVNNAGGAGPLSVLPFNDIYEF